MEIERAEINQVAPRGLGKVSAQTSESMHGKSEKYLVRYNPNWSNPNSHIDDTCRPLKMGPIWKLMAPPDPTFSIFQCLLVIQSDWSTY